MKSVAKLVIFAVVLAPGLGCNSASNQNRVPSGTIKDNHTIPMVYPVDISPEDLQLQAERAKKEITRLSLLDAVGAYHQVTGILPTNSEALTSHGLLTHVPASESGTPLEYSIDFKGTTAIFWVASQDSSLSQYFTADLLPVLTRNSAYAESDYAHKIEYADLVASYKSVKDGTSGISANSILNHSYEFNEKRLFCIKTSIKSVMFRYALLHGKYPTSWDDALSQLGVAPLNYDHHSTGNGDSLMQYKLAVCNDAAVPIAHQVYKPSIPVYDDTYFCFTNENGRQEQRENRNALRDLGLAEVAFTQLLDLTIETDSPKVEVSTSDSAGSASSP